MKINDTLVTDPSEVAEKLGRHFSDISSPHNYSEEFQKVRDAQISLNFESDKFEAYNAKFSLREFREALISSEATAPSEDSIMNKIWETGILPKDWKISIIVPVKKPN